MGFVNLNNEKFDVYLTPMARAKLYTGGGGDLQIKYFSLHDGDINYTKEKSNDPFTNTPAGKYTQVPNLRGDPKVIGVNGCQINGLEDFIVRNQGPEEKCPAGYVKGIDGECIEVKYLRQQNREISKKLVKAKEEQKVKNNSTGGARIVTQNNKTNTSTPSGGY